MKSIKIRIEDEDHARKVQDHLFALGYEWISGKKTYFNGKIDVITAYDDGDGKYIYFCSKDNFNNIENQEVELITKVSEEGEVCTYLKTVEKKKFGFEVDGDYLVAVDEKGDTLAYLLISCAKVKLEGLGYDTSSYKWNDNGSIKII